MQVGFAMLAFLVVSVAGLYLYAALNVAKMETRDLSTLAPLPGAQFLQTRSGRVHVLDMGQGPPILLLHGSGRGLIDWQQGLAQRLAEHHRVIAFDYYGSGFSERRPQFVYGYDLWVAQAVDVLDALDVERATVVGHSVGGAIACIFAVEHSERVSGVVTIGTGMEIEPQQFALAAPGLGEAVFARMAYYGSAQTEAQQAALEEAFRVRGTRAAMLQYVRRQMTVDGLRLVTGVFEDVRAPVLHLSGSADVNISPRAAGALARRTGGRFQVIEGVGRRLDRRLETDRQLGEAEVVVDGLGDADQLDATAGGKFAQDLQAAVAADADERIELQLAIALDHLVCAVDEAAVGHREGEGIALVGGAEDGAAEPQHVAAVAR
ncbi:MAG: alpha/beta hydrolase [Rhodospirillales bacterium]|nr:alpha/beta hydrolase [Rhodospirillales bacterium]